MKKSAAAPAVLLGLIGLSIILLSMTGVLDVSYDRDFAQGEIDATRVDISPKLTGRVLEQLVEDGTSVKKGDLLLVIDSPEMEARVNQARAALAQARAVQAKAHRGARDEEVRQAETSLSEAQAARRIAQQTYERVRQLHANKAISSQDLDESRSQLSIAREREERAAAALEMARTGSRIEDIEAADAQADLAQAALDEALATSRDIRLSAPMDGEVSKVLVRQGELVTPGYPVVSLVDLNDVWSVVQLREKYLNHVTMGGVYVGTIPALGDRKVRFRVTYISPLGDFATWRATNSSGSYDMKTFEVHSAPVEPVPGLRPGMSVIFSLEDNPVEN